MDDKIGTLKIKEGDRERTILIPGAEDMPKQQLEDIVEWQTTKTREELRQPRPERKYSKKEVGQALKDYNEFRKRRAEGTRKYF